MLEMEMKFSLGDFAELDATLSEWGLTPTATEEESDHYFNAPDRDFKQTDEAFRLRCVGAKNRMTYKGPKQKGPVKTRTEIEIAIEPGPAAAEQFRRLLVCLGYRPTAIVRKTRTSYSLHRGGFDLQICRDHVDGIGCFAEIEIVAESARQLQAEAVLMQLAQELGLKNLEARSYLRMVLEATGRE